MYTITFSNQKMTYIKFVELDELSNIGIHHFFSWNHFGFQIWSKIITFKTIQIFNSQTWSHEKDQTQQIIFIEHDFTKF
jgi:hypothetical protein